ARPGDDVDEEADAVARSAEDRLGLEPHPGERRARARAGALDRRPDAVARLARRVLVEDRVVHDRDAVLRAAREPVLQPFRRIRALDADVVRDRDRDRRVEAGESIALVGPDVRAQAEA